MKSHMRDRFKRCDKSAERIKPILIIMVNVAVPPYVIKGNGTPTTGIIPITMPIFIKKYKKKVMVKPATSSRGKIWLKRKAIR